MSTIERIGGGSDFIKLDVKYICFSLPRFRFVLTVRVYRCKGNNAFGALRETVSSSLIRNFVGHPSGPSKTPPVSGRERSAPGAERKVRGLRRTNGGIQLGSRRLNEDRRRVGSGTRVEARPQSETNRREEGQACQHSR